MTKGSPKTVIFGAGIAGVATAYCRRVGHGWRDVALLEAENRLPLTSDKSIRSLSKLEARRAGMPSC